MTRLLALIIAFAVLYAQAFFIVNNPEKEKQTENRDRPPAAYFPKISSPIPLSTFLAVSLSVPKPSRKMYSMVS